MTNNKKLQIGFIFFIFCLSLSIHIFDDFKTTIKSSLGFDDSHILSSIIGFHIDKEQRVDIFKIKKSESLFIEVYEHKSHVLIQQIPFEESYDAYFKINNRSTNLFSSNLGHSKNINLYIPVYSKNLKASLYAFKYDKNLKQFIIVN